MFQTFDNKSAPQFGASRVAALRSAMAELKIDSFLVPRADDYQGEYVPASAERLSWLTGFTGSAGVALITADQAIIFVDGRYTTQLAAQVDTSVFTAGDLVGAPPSTWLSDVAPQGFVLGIDPWLHTSAEFARFEKALAAKGGKVLALDSNLLDGIWSDRPAEPLEAVVIHPETLAGEMASSKLKTIAAAVEKSGAVAGLIADPSSIAWMFNIRSTDVPHTPHPLARAIVHANGSAELFIDNRKLSAEVTQYLLPLTAIYQPELIVNRLSEIAANGASILSDQDLTPLKLSTAIEVAGGTIIAGSDPARLPRACKHEAELSGSAAAHIQDGAAMVNYLYWLDQQPAGTITEIEAVKALEAARVNQGEAQQNPLRDISFDTISGSGPNAAIIHYRVTTDTDRKLGQGEMFLIDSGAQYVNGTTDITRTVAIGDVPLEQKRFFTLVLKGMIAISTARFPVGTRGMDLDPLARIALWKAGGDYGHGTGHGVGSYLSVHEGPQRIARQTSQEILPGMILSNEPGYYRPGQYGIRIENLIFVKDASEIEGGDRKMLSFETLTWCPIDLRLVVAELLTKEEYQWLNDYHAKTREKLMPLIEKPEVKAWLENATRAL